MIIGWVPAIALSLAARATGRQEAIFRAILCRRGRGTEKWVITEHGLYHYVKCGRKSFRGAE